MALWGSAWALWVAVAIASSVVTFWGLGGAVHAWFYWRRRQKAAVWKLQPERFLTPGLARHAFGLGSANLLLGALIAGTFMWHLARGGWSCIYFAVRLHGIGYLAVSFVLAFFAIDAGLYYSHRLLHRRWLFRHVHRWHHRYVAPTVFTTTAMHPLEFLIFVAVLLVPAFVLPIHAGVYGAVIGYTYFIGMLDHSGIRAPFSLPLHGSNRFHDDHHVAFHCNYGHHTALFDRLHGTVRRADRRYDEHTFEDEQDGDATAPQSTEDAAHVRLSRLR